MPLRYCMSTARSDVNSLISDVMSNNVVIRAYRDQDPGFRVQGFAKTEGEKLGVCNIRRGFFGWFLLRVNPQP